ncbi:MAG: hypothetical protein JWO51_94 [Rhodospirillales bacterium]|nr:hypothetical protein [Rhodospirillales bacterium]
MSTALPDLFGAPPAAHDPGGKLLPLAAGITGSAVFGGPLDCYRYRLERVWDVAGAIALFIMMNPSSANPLLDDRTVAGITRKVRFHWPRRGLPTFGRLVVANTFAYRCAYQARLAEVDDPVGPENDRWIDELAAQADIIVFACGTPKIKALRSRGPAVADRLVTRGFNLYALKVTGGMPWHPLYIPDNTEPTLWRPAA